MEEATFSPLINKRSNSKQPIEPYYKVYSRLHDDFNKRSDKLKEKQVKAKEVEKINNTFSPNLIAKSIPKVFDNSDDENEASRTVHERLYKKHRAVYALLTLKF